MRCREALRGLQCPVSSGVRSVCTACLGKHPRDDTETRRERASKSRDGQSEAVDVPVEPGDALIISPGVMHGSHPAKLRERVAFSPLYEWER